MVIQKIRLFELRYFLNDLFKNVQQASNIYAPVGGKMIIIEDMSNEVFSSKMMGDGVFSLCSDKLTLVGNNDHAFGITMAT
ncbi:MAG: PTS glucose transporter subunit IIA [Erysipelotrichaceae bacterium]|nr:PTS glucose transporter subunit IIA [Erysipelotrichaceae bacterium]